MTKEKSKTVSKKVEFSTYLQVRLPPIFWFSPWLGNNLRGGVNHPCYVWVD
jgi:hypothetical protein